MGIYICVQIYVLVKITQHLKIGVIKLHKCKQLRYFNSLNMRITGFKPSKDVKSRKGNRVFIVTRGLKMNQPGSEGRQSYLEMISANSNFAYVYKMNKVQYSTVNHSRDYNFVEYMENNKTKDGRYKNLIELIANVEFLLMSYNMIKSKPGNMSVGSDKMTLDGISYNYFKETSIKIVNEEFKFKPCREVAIPKSAGKTRILGVGNPRQKIVQQSIYVILNYIFDKDFSIYSHGFRPNKSCHTALRQLKLANNSSYR